MNLTNTAIAANKPGEAGLVEIKIMECFDTGFVEIRKVAEVDIKTQKCLFDPKGKHYFEVMRGGFRSNYFSHHCHQRLRKNIKANKAFESYAGFITEIQIYSSPNGIKAFEAKILNCYMNSVFLIEKQYRFVTKQIGGTFSAITESTVQYTISILTLNLEALA